MRKNFEIIMANKRFGLKGSLRHSARTGGVFSKYSHDIPVIGKGESLADFAGRLALYHSKVRFVEVSMNGRSHYVAFGVSGPLVTKYGVFELIPAEVVGGVWGRHYFAFYPSVAKVLGTDNVLMRIDSGCLSGQVFGDMLCDCDEQLNMALKACANSIGLVIHIPAHDGRGWGDHKMANQRLMYEHGLDTVAAARLYYGDEKAIDRRTYDEAAVILKAFGFSRSQSFELATNNPKKIAAVQSAGLKVAGVRSITARTKDKKVLKNLEAKKREWGHRLEL